MDVLFDCSKCGKRLSIPDAQAGGNVRCPHCGEVISAPAASSVPPAPAPAPPSAPTAPWTQLPSEAPPAGGRGPDMAARDRLLGILTLVGAGLNLLLALFWVLETVLFSTGALDAQLKAQGPDTPKEVTLAVFLVLVVTGLVTAAVALAAGLRMLRGSAGARGWALGSGIMMCCSLWSCCLWPLNLGLGIYSLVVFFQDRPA